MLSQIVSVQHKQALVRPLNAGIIPFLVPRILRPIKENLGSTIGAETEPAEEKVALDR